MLEQKNKGRAKVKVAVFFVLAVHGVGLLAALLMQGCRREEGGTAAQTNNVASPVFADATNLPAASNAEVVTPIPVPPTNPPVADTTSVPAGAAQDYKIVAGDNFSTLAKKFGVTTAAIVAANPGAEPTKLHPGQTIHIPAPAPVATAVNHTAPVTNP